MSLPVLSSSINRLNDFTKNAVSFGGPVLLFGGDFLAGFCFLLLMNSSTIQEVGRAHVVAGAEIGTVLMLIGGGIMCYFDKAPSP